MVQSHIQPNPCHPLTVLYNAKHCCHQRFLLYSLIHFGGLARRGWLVTTMWANRSLDSATSIYWNRSGVVLRKRSKFSMVHMLRNSRVDCVLSKRKPEYTGQVQQIGLGPWQSEPYSLQQKEYNGSQRTDPRLVYTGCSAERGQYNQFTRPATVSPYLGFWDIFFECCVTPFSYNAAIGIILCGSCFK